MKLHPLAWALALFVNIDAAQFTGTVAGIFNNPRPACAGQITCAGVGTSVISWGTPSTGQGSSGVIFTPRAFDVNAGVAFTLGVVTLQNREIQTGTFSDFFDLTITFNITNQSATSTRTLRMNQVSTQNLGTPQENADWISFSPDLATRAFFVLENQSEAVELRTSFSAGLMRSLAANLAGPEIDAITFGRVLGPNGFVGPNPVPEPSTGVLILAPLAAFALRLRTRMRDAERTESLADRT